MICWSGGDGSASDKTDHIALHCLALHCIALHLDVDVPAVDAEWGAAKSADSCHDVRMTDWSACGRDQNAFSACPANNGIFRS